MVQIRTEQMMLNVVNQMQSRYEYDYENIIEELARLEIYIYYNQKLDMYHKEIASEVMERFGDNYSAVNDVRWLTSSHLSLSLAKMKNSFKSYITTKQQIINKSLNVLLKTDSNEVSHNLANKLFMLTGQQWTCIDNGYYHEIKNSDTGQKFGILNNNQWYLGKLSTVKGVADDYYITELPKDNWLVPPYNCQYDKIPILNLPITDCPEDGLKAYSNLVMTLKELAPSGKAEIQRYLTTENPLYSQIPLLGEAVSSVAFGNKELEKVEMNVNSTSNQKVSPAYRCREY